MKKIEQISLYYSEGRSDKEYHAELVEEEGGHCVNFRYGRRGGALASGTKTASPVDYEKAKKIYDKLVQEKTGKGYTPDVSGAAYQGTEHAGRQTGFVPQLLNPIPEEEATKLLDDPLWAAQEKMDGERRAVLAEKEQVTGSNRKGLMVALPQAIADELQAIAVQEGTIHVDGEIIGETLYVFDLHIHKGNPIHTLPWIERMRLAQAALSCCKSVKAIGVAVSSSEKHALWESVHQAHGEGIVFKRLDCPVSKGRPNSGGNWLKYKFTESASCFVLSANAGKRSVKIGLYDTQTIAAEGKPALTPVGNVTIPINQDIPVAGDIIEVVYLYAYKGGSLYQPVYRGKREDIDASSCNTTQLKFRPEGREEEDN